MSDDGRYNGAHVLMAFLAGAAAGAIVALLTAPTTGKDARDKVKDWAKDLESKASEIPSQIRSAYGRAAETAKSTFAKSSLTEDERGT